MILLRHDFYKDRVWLGTVLKSYQILLKMIIYMRESTEISRKVGPGGPQKKLKKIMEKALEKFRLPTLSSARSD